MPMYSHKHIRSKYIYQLVSIYGEIGDICITVGLKNLSQKKYFCESCQNLRKEKSIFVNFCDKFRHFRIYSKSVFANMQNRTFSFQP
jgi:hypothetical protein